MTKRAKLPTVEELAAHAREIAKAFKIELIEDNNLCAAPENAVVLHLRKPNSPEFHHAAFVRVLVDETAYAVALHEMGHCVAPLGNIPGAEHNIELSLMQEHAAWQWAESISLDWTPAMQQVRDYALGSYEKHAIAQRAQAVRSERDAVRREVQLKDWIKKLR